MTLERKVLTECLILYKEFPCLWDNRQVLYSNKEARDQAYEVLLEKYRQLVEDATVLDMKRRIDSMRTSYRREHKKVLLERLKGREYTPMLWYYGLLNFLNEVMEFNILESQPDKGDATEESIKLEFENDSSSSFRRSLDTHKLYKRKKTSSIYLQEQQDTDDECREVLDQSQSDQHDLQDQNNYTTNYSNSGVTETEAFGTTVGLQLKELDPMQKIYAEKLISDVIYHARLQRLSFNSNLNI